MALLVKVLCFENEIRKPCYKLSTSYVMGFISVNMRTNLVINYQICTGMDLECLRESSCGEVLFGGDTTYELTRKIRVKSWKDFT